MQGGAIPQASTGVQEEKCVQKSLSARRQDCKQLALRTNELCTERVSRAEAGLPEAHEKAYRKFSLQLHEQLYNILHERAGMLHISVSLGVDMAVKLFLRKVVLQILAGHPQYGKSLTDKNFLETTNEGHAFSPIGEP
ncbi:MAG: hypothetical protein H3C45_12410, partial [Bacteroidia bacterium]|nr:hypothetical protein [Bacteroidia bacterium]